MLAAFVVFNFFFSVFLFLFIMALFSSTLKFAAKVQKLEKKMANQVNFIKEGLKSEDPMFTGLKDYLGEKVN